MARATISFISVIMLTKLIICNCSDCRGLSHIATNDADYHKYFYYVADL